MIFEALKRSWAKREIKKSIKNGLVSNSGKLETVLLICAASEIDPVELRNTIARGLKIEVDKLTLVRVSDKNSYSKDLDYINFHKEMIGLLGGIKNDQIDAVLKSQFDLQINYFKESSWELNFIAGTSQARLKIGVGDEQDEISDLKVNIEIYELENFVEELNKYLKIIK